MGQRLLLWLLAVALSLGLHGAASAAAPEPATGIAARPEAARNAGSYEVAPVRILGIPALVVASPQLHNGSKVVEARQRAELIEGNLRLLYAPQALCSQAERLSEDLLEQLVLGGPKQQRLCSGDPWAVNWAAEQLRLESEPGPSGTVVLKARLPGRPVPLPLLTVTAADGQLHGLEPEQLAEQWRQLLQRRLLHARRTMQPDQLSQRWRLSAGVGLLMMLSIVLSLRHWGNLRNRLSALQDQAAANHGSADRRPWRLLWQSRLVFVLVMLQLLALVSVVVAATPGRVPLALALLLQPIEILIKAAGVVAVVVLLKLVLRLLLRQWRSNPDVPWQQLARRKQRYANLLQAGCRLLNLAGLLVLLALVLIGIPGISATPLSTWLAGGALLGALAFVFQSLLRDFVAGLVILLEDHYAVGDWVEVDGLEGDVEDVGVLATQLRGIDQRVAIIPNSRCDRLVNHTRLRSGMELIVPLHTSQPELERALAVLQEVCDSFAAQEPWNNTLLQPPWLRGVRQITPMAVEVSVLLVTSTGEQWAAKRALLGQIVTRFEQEGLKLAQVPVAIS